MMKKNFHHFLRSFAAIEEKKILVHGGGKLATKLAEKMGVEQNLLMAEGSLMQKH